jgi:hypothetical protein
MQAEGISVLRPREGRPNVILLTLLTPCVGHASLRFDGFGFCGCAVMRLHMTDEARGYLIRQFEITWKLANFHLVGLGTEECLWRPAQRGLHVQQVTDGRWRADWPDHERYDLGPPSIAWLTWHIGFWWSMVIDHSFGGGTLTRENVMWPGTAGQALDWIQRLQVEWREALDQITDSDLQSPERTRWPFKDRPFGDVIAWVNVELTKNAAEIGYVRFLYAVRPMKS